MKQFALSKSPPPTKPPISEQFFHDLSLCLNFKNKKPPSINFIGAGGWERKLC